LLLPEIQLPGSAAKVSVHAQAFQAVAGAGAHLTRAKAPPPSHPKAYSSQAQIVPAAHPCSTIKICSVTTGRHFFACICVTFLAAQVAIAMILAAAATAAAAVRYTA